MSQNPLDREEMESLLAARQELGPAMEPALVDSFAQKILMEVQRQSRINEKAHEQQRELERTRSHQQPSGAGRLSLAIVSLVMAIPLTAIALDLSSMWMAVVIWVGIVLVNFAYGSDRRGGS